MQQVTQNISLETTGVIASGGGGDGNRVEVVREPLLSRSRLAMRRFKRRVLEEARDRLTLL